MIHWSVFENPNDDLDKIFNSRAYTIIISVMTVQLHNNLLHSVAACILWLSCVSVG